MAKKKQKSLFHPVNIEIYGKGIGFSLGQDNQELHCELFQREVLIDDIEHALTWKKGAVGMTFFMSEGQILVRMKYFPESCKEYGTLQHEIFHAVVQLLRQVGVDMCSNSEEAFAYLISYVTEEIYKAINEL